MLKKNELDLFGRKCSIEMGRKISFKTEINLKKNNFTFNERLFLINTKPIDRGWRRKIIRIAQRNFFEKSGFHVWEIAAVIDQENNIDYSKGVVYIHQNGNVLKLLRASKLNLIEDYLDLWIKSTFNSIKDLIKKDDIVFSLSGGELSTIKLGSIIKKILGVNS